MRFGRRTDPAALARRCHKTESQLVDFFLDLFLQGDVAPQTRARLVEYHEHSRRLPFPVYWTKADIEDHRIRALCHLVLTLPEFQLC